MPRLKNLPALLLLAVLLAGCGGDSGADSPLREGRTVYGDVCSVCHGDRGQGVVGPALDEVLETWPTCDAHVEWITLGSDEWQVQYGDTYGATDKPITGVMPGQGTSLTESEIRLVAAFERVSYGGQDEAEALADCRIE